MRTLSLTLLLLSVLAVTPPPARAQDVEPPDGTRVESAEVSGIPDAQLSPGLRRDIDALAGKPLTRPDVTQLARRIEEELTYPGQIRVMVIRESRSVDYAK